MRHFFTLPAALVALAFLLVPALAFGHAERATHYPDGAAGKRPVHRNSGPSQGRVQARLGQAHQALAGPGAADATARAPQAPPRLMKKCRYRHIQQAVDAAKTGDRILIMPGVYREEPSRKIPVKDPKCEGDEYWEASGDNHTEDGRVPTYKHQVDCPNARNLIASSATRWPTTTRSATRSATSRCRAWAGARATSTSRATASSRTSSAPTAPTASSSTTSASSRAATTTSTWSRRTASGSRSSSPATRRTTGS